MHKLYVLCNLIILQIDDADRGDRRLNFPRQNTAITKYMDAAWKMKEQTQNMN